jgi:hypothetical protein
VVAHIADVNAAGSFFALMVCVAAGVLARALAEGSGGRTNATLERMLWAAGVAAAGIGLWLATSRSATWSVILVVPVTIGSLLLRRWSPRRRAFAVAALAIVLVAAGAMRARLLERDPTYRGAGMRTEFAEASLRMIAERPAFGAGIGRYYATSRLFLPPSLAWVYGFENAHNYFLQITAETGIIGGMLFGAFVGGLVWRTATGVRAAPADYRLIGCAAGLTAFLVTCLTGHPLLVPEVAIPFWIVAGLACALAGSNLLRDRPYRSAQLRQPVGLRVAVGAVAVALAASVPWRAERPRMTPPRAIEVTGLYPAQFGADGSVLQWSTQYGSVFVPAAWRAVELPLRAAPESMRAGQVGVEISTGAPGPSRFLVGDYWTLPLINLGDAPPAGGLKRIDFKVDRLTRVGDRDVGVAVQAPRPFSLR